MRKCIPPPELIPSGICECGCGKPTKVANYTIKKQGMFEGYPTRFLQGHSHASAKRGKEHYKYRNGRYCRLGYTMVLISREHPMADKNGYIPEHRYVMSQHLGRPLTSKEQVHHINGNISDNRLENLEILTCSQHRIIHATKWNRENIAEAFSKFITETGKPPKKHHPNFYRYLPSHRAVKRVFGSWEFAIESSKK